MKNFLAPPFFLYNVKKKKIVMSSSKNNLKSITNNNIYLDNKWNMIFTSITQTHKWFYCLVIVLLFYKMSRFKFIITISLFSVIFSQDPYSLEDVNPNSTTYGQNVGSSFFSGKVVLHYFGAFTWGTCTTRFGELNEINDDLKSSGYQVELIGVSKSSWQAGLVNWANQGNASICIDESPYLVWDDWEATQRDLFITDLNGQVVYKQNITSGIPSNIVDIISGYLNVQNETLPDRFSLKQNYPNPFNGLTVIEYSIPSASNVLLKIYDMSGKEIRTLHNGYHNSGSATIIWDGKDKNSQLVASGIYFYSMVFGRNSKVKKLTLVK